MAEPTLEQAKKSLGIDQGDPKTQYSLTETRRGFNITHPMGNFANAKNGVGQGISFIKANRPHQPIWFPGFMLKFSDSFVQNINKEKVFGRMDPLQVFESTERRITFSWQVVSVNEEEATHSLYKINELVKAMYPDYRENNSKTGYYVTTSALIGISFHGLAHGNLSQKAKKNKSQNTEFVEGSTQYLFGYLESLTIDHDFETGIFDDLTYDGEQAKSDNRTSDSNTIDKKGSGALDASTPIAAKVININATFSPIHPETLGHDEKGEWLSANNFPYYAANGAPAELPDQFVGMTPFIGSTFEVSEQKRAAYEAYQAQLRAQEASILGSQNPWERAGNKIADGYNKTVDFFDSLVTTEGEDPNTGL